MEQLQLKFFLTQISAIIRQYSKIEELTGENFNVFKILGLTIDEVRTHSAFIAELLNPKGSHGKEDIFLHLFLEQMEIKDFISENARVVVEKRIGVISSDNTEGGNMDIIALNKKNQAVIIENKIYAADQPSQLLRYYNYGNKYHKDSFTLFYLTLDGKDASEGSKGELSKLKYRRISYSQEILNWLVKCKEKSVDHPILRETITQYIYLIRLLTGQTKNNDMAKDIITSIVDNKDNLTAFLTLLKSDVVDGVRKELIISLKKQVEDIAEELKLEKPDFNEDLGFVGERYMNFYLPKSPEKKYYVAFGFNGKFADFIYGIECIEKNQRDKYREEIEKRLGKPVKWPNWVWVSRFEFPFRDWNNNIEPWLAISSGAMKENIKEKLSLILSILERLDLS